MTAFELSEQRYEQTFGRISVSPRFLLNTTVWVQTLIARTNLIRQLGGFDPNLRYGEDADLVFRLGLKTNFCFVNIPLTEIDRMPARHIGPSRIWNQGDFRLQQLQYRFEKWLSLSADLPNEFREAFLEQLRSVHSSWANLALTNGQYDEALQAIGTAAKYHLTPGIAIKWILTRVSPPLARSIILWRERRRAERNRGIVL